MYMVSDIMNDQSFMNLCIYQMFSPFNWDRANLGCETRWISSLVNNDLRSTGFSNASLSFCEPVTETWSKIDRISILIEYIPFLRVAKQLLN